MTTGNAVSQAPPRRHDLGNTPKWGFCGGPAPELEHLIGLSVKHLHKQGAANPVVPLNCDDDLTSKPKLRGRDARAIALSGASP